MLNLSHTLEGFSKVSRNQYLLNITFFFFFPATKPYNVGKFIKINYGHWVHFSSPLVWTLLFVPNYSF